MKLYQDDFKAIIVKMHREEKRSIRSLSEEFGVSPAAILPTRVVLQLNHRVSEVDEQIVQDERQYTIGNHGVAVGVYRH